MLEQWALGTCCLLWWSSWNYTANPFPVMKTGIPCAHILTGKTCAHYRDTVHIAGNLFSKQVVPCTPLVLPCTGLLLFSRPSWERINIMLFMISFLSKLLREALVNLIIFKGNFRGDFCEDFWRDFWGKFVLAYHSIKNFQHDVEQ